MRISDWSSDVCSSDLHLIGGALVGTFSGILISYGFVSPLAAAAKATWEHEGKYLLCMKAGMLAHLQGYAPAVSVEFARKSLMSNVRPSFYEVEEATSKEIGRASCRERVCQYV